jgi:hypothetical protein
MGFWGNEEGMFVDIFEEKHGGILGKIWGEPYWAHPGGIIVTVVCTITLCNMI